MNDAKQNEDTFESSQNKPDLSPENMTPGGGLGGPNEKPYREDWLSALGWLAVWFVSLTIVVAVSAVYHYGWPGAEKENIEVADVDAPASTEKVVRSLGTVLKEIKDSANTALGPTFRDTSLLGTVQQDGPLGDETRRYHNAAFGTTFHVPSGFSIEEFLHYDMFEPGVIVVMEKDSMRVKVGANPRRIGEEGFDLGPESVVTIDGEPVTLSVLRYIDFERNTPTTVYGASSVSAGFERFGRQYYIDVEGGDSEDQMLALARQIAESIRLEPTVLPKSDNPYISGQYGFHISLPKGFVLWSKDGEVTESKGSALEPWFRSAEAEAAKDIEVQRLIEENEGEWPAGVEPARWIPSISFKPDAKLSPEDVYRSHKTRTINGHEWTYSYDSTMDILVYAVDLNKPRDERSKFRGTGFTFVNFYDPEHPIILETLHSFLPTQSSW